MVKRGKSTKKKNAVRGIKDEPAEKEKKPPVFSELLATPPIDSTDIKLLQILQNQGRISNIDIAEKLNMSEATVRRRINNLIERDWIRGFCALLNHNKLGNNVKASVYAKVRKNDLDNVANVLKKSDCACSIYQVMGNYNLFGELLFRDMLGLQEFIDNLSQMEPVEQVEYHIVTKAYKPCPWSGI